MGSLGATELIVIAVVVVLLFGTRKLPELGAGLGKAINNFKKSYKEASAIDVTPTNEKKDEKGGSGSGSSGSGSGSGQ